MAYMSQEKKAVIAERLKKIIPKTWKYSLRVQHHSTLILTVQSVPANMIQNVGEDGYFGVNEYYIERNQNLTEAGRDIVMKIKDAMMEGNYNNSDAMSDYFDVGYYISIQFGKWDKALIVN